MVLSICICICRISPIILFAYGSCHSNILEPQKREANIEYCSACLGCNKSSSATDLCSGSASAAFSTPPLSWLVRWVDHHHHHHYHRHHHHRHRNHHHHHHHRNSPIVTQHSALTIHYSHFFVLAGLDV